MLTTIIMMIAMLIILASQSWLPLLDTCSAERAQVAANLRTNIMDFRGLDSSIIIILRGGIPRPVGDFPESLSQAIFLVGVMLVGRLS